MKTLTGVVISNKMNKAAIVEIKFVKKDPLYKKRMIVKRKIHVENLPGAKVGDKVRIQECRPISKTIAFRILEVFK